MFRIVAIAGIASTLWLGAAKTPTARGEAAKVVSVKVHCRSGNTPGFVTPNKVTINLGDTIEWTVAGNVAIESLEITLKDPEQAWPFAGARTKGGNRGVTGAARSRGTYGYNVNLTCRVRGEAVREVIDPDIIIL